MRHRGAAASVDRGHAHKGTLAPATQAWRRIPPAWRLPSFIGLLSLALLSLVWGIGMLVRTPTGTILIQAVPEGVEVLVDDGAVKFKRRSQRSQDRGGAPRRAHAEDHA